MDQTISGRALRSATSRRRRRLVTALLKAGGPALPTKPPPDRPVFVLGSPRSGTTLLFEALGRSPHLGSLGVESHLLWEMFHPVIRPDRITHQVGPDEVTSRERRVLYWAIDRLSGGRRYLDKAPRNCLRVPYLDELFPGANFVYLKRDGRAAVSSLITGWRAPGGMFPGTKLPAPLDIQGYDGRTWKFLVPRGWEAYTTGKSLAEVCAFQWVAANQALLDARGRIAPERWIELTYEELVASPRDQLGALLGRLALPQDPAVLDRAVSLDRHVTKAVTAPRRDKWRQENPEEIGSILPLIEPTMRRMGYQIEQDDPV